jgi:cell division protein FtsB
VAVLERDQLRARAAAGEQADARLSWRLLTGAIVIVGLAALLPVLQTSSATERGAAIRRLEQQKTVLQAEVNETEAEIAVLASTDRIGREARLRLGMVDADVILYVPLEGAAPRQTVPERYLPIDTTPPPAAESPWWRRLADMLPRP